MTRKRAALDVIALSNAAGPTLNPVDRIAARRTGATVQQNRIGRVQLQGYFPPEYRTRLKILSATTGRTMEELLTEALDNLFALHNV